MAQGAGGGRPTKYKAAYHCKQAKALSRLGATEFELAQFFELATSTITLWMQQHPKFSAAIKLGKAPSDKRTERSLFHRANGYNFESEELFLVDEVIETPAPTEKDSKAVIITRTKKVLRVPIVKHVPPDPTSIIFWLKNRRKDRWRDFKATELSTPLGRPLEMAQVPPGQMLLQDYYAKVTQSAAAADPHPAAARDLGSVGRRGQEPDDDPEFSPR
jgi:hypothetical protein